MKSQGRSNGQLRRWLVVMVKEPAAGRVKSRLARAIGAAHAVNFYRHTAAGLFSRLDLPGAWTMLAAITPDHAIGTRAYPWHLERVAQGSGDLGARMQRIMDQLPPGPVLIIGSDVPGITQRHIWAGFRALGHATAVFGPSPDGGYWIAGLKRVPRVPRAFAHVRWSGPHALADTMANFKAAEVTLLDEMSDIDEPEDLAAYGGSWGRRVRSPR
jgi:uncharacterized protein